MRSRLLAPAGLSALVILFFWKLVLTNQYTWLDSPDLANLVLPWFQFQAGEWHHGRFPLWDPYGWGGQPLFGQAQPGSAYPLNWLLFLAPLHQGWIAQLSLHWYYVVIRILAALTMYALCRDLGRGRAASVFGGLVFALGGYVATTDWPQMVNGAVWAPLVFLYLFRAARGVEPLRSSILSGFFLGFTWLAGHHQMQLFLSLAAAGVWLAACLRPAAPRWRLARLAALSIGVAILASAFQTIPTAEYGRLARRWSGTDEPLRFNETVPYKVHKQYALSPVGILGVAIPGVAGNADPFVGVVAVTLALLGLAMGWADTRVRWLAAVALFGLLFTLGPLSLLHGWFYALVPLVEKARVPAAGILLFSLGVAPMVAFGVDSLPSPGAWRKWLRRAMALFGAATLFACLLFTVTRVPVWISDDRLIVTGFIAVVAAALLYGFAKGNISRRAALTCLGGLMLTELANETGFWWPSIYDKDRNSFLKPMAEHSDIVEFLRTRPGFWRAEIDSAAIPYNIGDWYGFETFESYVASVPASLWRFDVFSARFRQFYGIRYRVAAKALRPDQRDLFTGRTGLKVFENPDTFPRAWAVHQAISAGGEKEAVATMADPGFDLRTRAFLIGPVPALETCADDEVEVKSHLANRVQIEANMRCRGMVILADTWFPGWQATIDGRPAVLHQANGVVRGVVVDRGTHRIEMRYRPRSVLLGAALTAAAAILAGVVFFRRGR